MENLFLGDEFLPVKVCVWLFFTELLVLAKESLFSWPSERCFVYPDYFTMGLSKTRCFCPLKRMVICDDHQRMMMICSRGYKCASTIACVLIQYLTQIIATFIYFKGKT